MTLDQLKIFAAVVEHQSVTEAAGVLHMSQPGITQQLQRLQSQFNAVFYRRTGRGIEITDCGRAFYQSIKPGLRQLAEVEASYRAGPNPRRQERFKVGGTAVTSAALLPALLGQFKKAKPGVEIEFRSRSAEGFEKTVLKSLVEISMGTRQPDSVRLQAEAYRKVGLVLFAAPNHPLARKPRVSVSDLLSHSWLVRSSRTHPGTSSVLLKRLSDDGLDIRVGCRCDSSDAVKAAVRQRLGIGLAFEDVVKAEAHRGEFKILKGHGLKLEGEAVLVYRKDRELSPAAQEFLALARGGRDSNGQRVQICHQT